MRFLTIPRSSFKKVDKGLLNYASGLIEKNRDTYRELPVRKENNNELTQGSKKNISCSRRMS